LSEKWARIIFSNNSVNNTQKTPVICASYRTNPAKLTPDNG